MSRRMAWALVAIGEGHHPEGVSPREVYRLRQALNRLGRAPEPELVLRSWLASRAQRRLLAGVDLDAVRGDPRVVLSGISDGRSGMSAGDQVEGYVRDQDVEGVLRDHLLVDAGARGDVVLHAAPLLPPSPVPVLLLAADLADHDGPRARGRARDLIVEWARARGEGES